MKTKTLIKINGMIAVILSLFFSIKGSMNYEWFSCLGLKGVVPCGFFRWLIQVIVLVIFFGAILTGIEYGIKRLFKKEKPGAVEETEEKSDGKVEEKESAKEEEKPTKKVIKI